MKSFANIPEFIAFMGMRMHAATEAEHHGLEHAAKLIEVEAKHEIGTYQDAAGPFSAWAPLSDLTLNGFDIGGRHIPGKIELGYSPGDNPLLRTGALRDAITSSVNGHVANIGVPAGELGQLAIWQEVGTHMMPGRSFLGGAAVRKGAEGARAVGASVAHALAGLPTLILK